MTNGSASVKYTSLVIGVLLLSVLGFIAFVKYIHLDLIRFSGSGLIFLGIAAGAASFFSPCSFPLLVTLITHETDPTGDGTRPLVKSLGTAAALSLGVTTFLIVLGGLIAAGAAPVMRQVTFTSTEGRLLRALVGGALILLGFLQVKGVKLQLADRFNPPLQRLQARLQRTSPFLGFAMLGFGYVLAGFG